MTTFKIIFTNGMYVIHETKNVTYPDIQTYTGLRESDVSKRFIKGKLFDKDGNGPINDGYVDFFDHSVLICFKVKS